MKYFAIDKSYIDNDCDSTEPIVYFSSQDDKTEDDFIKSYQKCCLLLEKQYKDIDYKIEIVATDDFVNLMDKYGYTKIVISKRIEIDFFDITYSRMEKCRIEKLRYEKKMFLKYGKNWEDVLKKIQEEEFNTTGISFNGDGCLVSEDGSVIAGKGYHFPILKIGGK